jgi:hypothetical protein
VVHHALIAVLVLPLERRFSSSSHAIRQGYGTHHAPRRFARACRERRWVFQAAIRPHFPSINHQLVLAQLEQQIACPATLWWLLRSIPAKGAIHSTTICTLPPSAPSRHRCLCLSRVKSLGRRWRQPSWPAVRASAGS